MSYLHDQHGLIKIDNLQSKSVLNQWFRCYNIEVRETAELYPGKTTRLVIACQE